MKQYIKPQIKTRRLDAPGMLCSSTQLPTGEYDGSKFTEDAKASIIQPRSVWHHLDDDDE